MIHNESWKPIFGGQEVKVMSECWLILLLIKFVMCRKSGCFFECSLMIANYALSLVDSIEQIGSVHFTAPEVLLHQSYSRAADMWSAGVLLYLLLCGQLPFDGPRDQLCVSVCQGAFDVCIIDCCLLCSFQFLLFIKLNIVLRTNHYVSDSLLSR